MSDQGDDGPVPVGAIGSALREPIEPSDAIARMEGQTFAHKERQFRNELGWVGGVLGGRREKSGNVAFIAIALSFIVVIAIVLIAAAGSLEWSMVGELVAAPVSIITMALGYLFGTNDNNSD